MPRAAWSAQADGWRLLVELGDRLGREADPAGANADICRWFSESLGVGVSIVLGQGTSLERSASWPPDGPLAEKLSTLVPGTPDQGGILSSVLRDTRAVHAPVVGRSELPVEVRSLAVLPLSTPGATLGAMILHSSQPAAIGPHLVAVVEQMASRLALALANAELRAALAQLEGAQEAARLREELLAALSHDMQTPLAVLLGSIKALQAVDDLAPKHRAGLYESMARRGAQLHRLVEQFLDYSRLEAGRPIEVRPSLTDVATAIRRVETEIGWRRPLEVVVADDLPPAFVDPDRLDQVLANLVSNALKFSPVDAPISVQARATEETVEIAVVDRGPGMDAAELEKAFLKFHRGAGSEGTRGTGLGLYVSKAVLEAQGGQLKAESRPGHGTRFTVVLSLHPSLSGGPEPDQDAEHGDDAPEPSPAEQS